MICGDVINNLCLWLWGAKGTGEILSVSYLIKLINGSIIAFIATPRPAMATKKAVMFSINVLSFEVAGWTELKSLCLSCLNIFLVKLNISINLEIKYRKQANIPKQDKIEYAISLNPLYKTLKLIQKFKEYTRIKKNVISLINSLIISHGFFVFPK